jgi:3-hydroxyacyl-CoA dehydrogenase / enoyl-CoA hydratase / 3-hydroxybutyryl-CoA epimerase
MINYHKDQENIVTLTLDDPDRSANVINAAFGEAFRQRLSQLQQEKPLAGVILTSAKKTFMAGGDLENLYAMSDPAEVFAMSQELKAGLRLLETLGVPVVAALNGTALGGGMEMALACHQRIALNDPKIKFGFPEVTLGLLPGGGGVTRLPRMIGLQASFPFLSEGKQVKPQEAKAAGLIDALAEDEADLLAQARAWILANPQAKQPWDLPKFRFPGGNAQNPQVAQMLAIAPAILRKETWGNYPAPQAIMNTAVEGSLVDFDTASRIESRYFASLVTSQTAKNMINAFWFQLNNIKAGHSRPADVPPQETRKVGVLGAGMMGHGIAYVTASAGMTVVLKDATLEKAQAGYAKIEALAQKGVARGRMSVAQKDELLARITPTAEVADLAGCDLIIEAVFEDRALKAQVTQEVEAVVYGEESEEGGDTAVVFASNTSTLPITSLATASQHPQNFIGIHFFSPVERMPLVEIIIGAETNPATLAKAFDYVLAIHKTPIVVNDSRGFYTSRVFGTYTQEGMALLAEGQDPVAIETAGRQAGMPVGPLAVTDEVSLSLVAHVRAQTRADLAAEGKAIPAGPWDEVIDFMVQEAQRLGKAHGAGFYDYPANGKKQIWHGLRTRFATHERPQLSQMEMIERLLFAQAIETVRCLEEGVLNSVADANIGSIFGWGFAPFQGGTLQYINAYGLPAFVARAEALAQAYGDRFVPPALLKQMAAQGETF